MRPDQRRTVTSIGVGAGALLTLAWLCRAGIDRYRGLVMDEQIRLWAHDVAVRAPELVAIEGANAERRW